MATRLARIMGCSDAEISDVLYTALLQHLGCTAYAHEVARVWGDDVVTTRVNFLSSSGEPADMWRVWLPGVAMATGRSKARVLATTVVTARRMESEGKTATCEVARNASQGLGLPEQVQMGLWHMFALWNGKGFPNAAGEAIPLAARIMQVALTAAISHHMHGRGRRRGGSAAHWHPWIRTLPISCSTERRNCLASWTRWMPTRPC